MLSKRLHIVCFDVPYPVSHGGFYDLFYKIVALHRQGVHIMLHCYAYGRSQQSELEQYCEKVFYYKRQNNAKGFSFHLPFIVASRRNKNLIQNLSADDAPIILEGSHCTYLLYKNYFPGRRILYRLHNIEHIYYRQLFASETSWLKKLYYRWESRLLKSYEQKVAPRATAVLAVSPADAALFKRYAPAANVLYLPVFLPQATVQGSEGQGAYCLYHGNLSVAENKQSARWLVERVFKRFSFPLIIAGRKPAPSLKSLVQLYPSVKLVADPPDDELKTLIQQAQINLVVSFNATGIKLKLINALLYGRHCIGNKAAIEGTGLENCCIIADTPEAMQRAITEWKHVPFKKEQASLRQQVLSSLFDSEANARQLIALLY